MSTKYKSMSIPVNDVKHVHYHVHYHDLNRTLPSSEDNLDQEVLPEPVEYSNRILKQKEDTPLSFLRWHPKLPQHVNQSLLDSRLEGETVLWAGAPNPSVMKKSFHRTKIFLITSVIITIFFVMLPMDLAWAVVFWLFPGLILICYDVYLLALFADVYSHRYDYYVITPTRVLFFNENDTFDRSLLLEDNVFWKVRYSKNDIGTISLVDEIGSDFCYSLYKINGFRFVKHLLLSLLAKTSALTAKTTSNIPHLNYCPQCGCNLDKE